MLLLLAAGLAVIAAAVPVTAEHAGSAHPAPVVGSFHGCPPSGRGGDPALNVLKNRIDEPAAPEIWTIDQLLALPSPAGVGRRKRADWPAAATATIARYEGAPVQVVGFLIRQKKQGRESTNCSSDTYVDYHWWVTAARGQLQAQSVVVEPSPRTIERHPRWKTAILRTKRYAEGEEPRLRITGWLLFDREHPEQIGEHRGTLWEIHPVTRIEIWNGSQWIDAGQP